MVQSRTHDGQEHCNIFSEKKFCRKKKVQKMMQRIFRSAFTKNNFQSAFKQQRQFTNAFSNLLQDKPRTTSNTVNNSIEPMFVTFFFTCMNEELIFFHLQLR